MKRYKTKFDAKFLSKNYVDIVLPAGATVELSEDSDYLLSLGVFEEIKEEIDCKCPCQACIEDSPHNHATTNGICPMFCESQEKKECKHFLPVKTFGLFGKPKYECRYCGLKYDGEKQEADGCNCRKTQPVKPSQWINQRMKELVEYTYKQSDIRSQDDVDNVRQWAEDKALLDFLDEHFSK